MDNIIKGFANALFMLAWADLCEEHNISLSGQRIEDVCPETPENVMEHATSILNLISKINRVTSLEALFETNSELPGHSSEPTEELFGHYLGMEYLGSGVSWMDDHPSHNLSLPYGEFHLFDLDNLEDWFGDTHR